MFWMGFKVDMINHVNKDIHFADDNFLERCCDVIVACSVEELRSFVGLFWPQSASTFFKGLLWFLIPAVHHVIINLQSVSLHSLNMVHSLLLIIKNYGLILIQFLVHSKCY